MTTRMEPKLLLGVLFLLVSTSHAQSHSDTVGVTCFHCDDDTNHYQFPACLQNPITCDVGDLCVILYGWETDAHIPYIWCDDRVSCRDDLDGHHIECPDGGNRVDSGVCELCCENNDCVSNMTDFLRVGIMSSRNLYCPGQCDVDNLEECINTGEVCDHTQFCQVKVYHGNTIYGNCVNDYNLLTCRDDLRDQPCPDDLSDQSAYDDTNRDKCWHDCCTTNECLYKHFGIHMANAAVPNTGGNLVPTITPSGGNVGEVSLWEKLRGNCQDSLETTFCQSLRTHHELCRDRRAVGICPQTCGICDGVNGLVCEDVTELCPDLKAQNPGFCDDEESVFQCPTTCGHCDTLLESIVVSVLNITEPITEMPPEAGTTIMSGPTTPTPAGLDCTTLKLEDCSHIGPLCETTFLGVVCPVQCDMCNRAELA